MSQVNVNDFDFNVDQPKKTNANEGGNKYESYSTRRQRKSSNISLILIMIEIAFIGITFILTLRKAISIVIKQNPIQNENVQISNKKKLTEDEQNMIPKESNDNKKNVNNGDDNDDEKKAEKKKDEYQQQQEKEEKKPKKKEIHHHHHRKKSQKKDENKEEHKDENKEEQKDENKSKHKDEMTRNQKIAKNITNTKEKSITDEKNELKGVDKKIIPEESIPDIKVCLCTHAKKETKYLKEFVEFYLNLGVDRIYIYNRNAEGGEETSFKKTLKEFKKTNKVRLEDWRGKGQLILDMMNHCYENHYSHYDWIIFYEPDEFIHLNGISNIKTFLGHPKFEQCKKIYLNWAIHTDNNLYHYEDEPVQLRFPKIMHRPKDPKNIDFNIVKSIIRGKQENIEFECLNRLNKKEKGCNGYGKIAKMERYRMVEPDFENFYIDHYFSKSVDEFIENMDKEDSENKDIHFKHDFEHYFKVNNMSEEKIKYIEEKTKLDLSKYKKK